MSHIFDPFTPSSEVCFGRDELVREIVQAVLERRTGLLFGGRQSGKTTVLLRIAQKYQSDRGNVAELNSLLCPIYVNLTQLPVEATPADFYKHLALKARDACSKQIDGFILSTLPSSSAQDVTVETFSSDIEAIVSATGQVEVRLLFLLDEASRVLGKRFPRGFQDNLFALIYGGELAGGLKIAILFAGSQELYRFSEDETSPIGSRASYHRLKNLSANEVKSFLTCVAVPDAKDTYSEALVERMYFETGGHPGLVARFIGGLNQSLQNSDFDLEEFNVEFCNNNRALFRLWVESLTKEARCLHDLLLDSAEMPRQKAIHWLDSSGFDSFEADRAIEELEFTGIAQYELHELRRITNMYWGYVKTYSFAKDTPKITVGASADNADIWTTIKKLEIALRSVLRATYQKLWGTDAETKALKLLGPDAAAKVTSNLTNARTRYPLTDRPTELDIFDAMYLGQLTQLMVANDVWLEFKPLFRDKRQLEDLIKPIGSVRTDEAHFLEVPPKEISRCNVHCQDLLAIIEKSGLVKL